MDWKIKMDENPVPSFFRWGHTFPILWQCPREPEVYIYFAITLRFGYLQADRDERERKKGWIFSGESQFLSQSSL